MKENRMAPGHLLAATTFDMNSMNAEHRDAKSKRLQNEWKREQGDQGQEEVSPIDFRSRKRRLLHVFVLPDNREDEINQ